MQDFYDALNSSLSKAMNEVNVGKLTEMEVTNINSYHYSIKVTDLREILFRFDREDKVQISSVLLYRIFLETGIIVKGFRPNKTTLREQYKMSMEDINKVLPASYPSKSK